MPVSLRPYQQEAIEAAREAIRGGAKNILICAPTGSGKTVLASHLIDECKNKGKRANFVVDRVSLIQQTSETFDRYGIDHGCIQASHPRFRPSLSVQLCSVQTVARRMWPESSLDIIDECHTINKEVVKRIQTRERVTVGLTATPFSKGLGKLYDAVINVTTTHALIDMGFLAPYRVFACAEPDMDGVKVKRGEWDEQETSKRALQVVGDVVAEYLKHGEGRRFMCSAVDTAHVEELQRQFLAAGINVATYTYRDRDDDRAETLREFRKPNSSIQGLITVTAASKGFDAPHVSCVIMARPLRKSLAEHIQFMGRGLRTADGKRDCLVLDHSGNMARFWRDMMEFFDVGCLSLDNGEKREKPKPEEKPELEPVKCPTCRTLHKPAPVCPNCGHQYPKRSSVEHVPGTLKEILKSGSPKQKTVALWPQIVRYAVERRGHTDDARKLALVLYKQIAKEWPKAEWSSSQPADEITPEVSRLIRNANANYAIRKAHERRKVGEARA